MFRINLMVNIYTGSAFCELGNSMKPYGRSVDTIDPVGPIENM